MDRPDVIGHLIEKNLGIALITKSGFDHAKEVQLDTPFQSMTVLYRKLKNLNYLHRCYIVYLNQYQIKAVHDFINIFHQVVDEYYPSSDK